jgi:hypothetical protein
MKMACMPEGAPLNALGLFYWGLLLPEQITDTYANRVVVMHFR